MNVDFMDRNIATGWTGVDMGGSKRYTNPMNIQCVQSGMKLVASLHWFQNGRLLACWNCLQFSSPYSLLGRGKGKRKTISILTPFHIDCWHCLPYFLDWRHPCSWIQHSNWHMLIYYVIIRLEARFLPNIIFTLPRVLAVFTRSYLCTDNRSTEIHY